MHIEIYRAVNNTKKLGDGHVHKLPRIGEALLWKDQTYRVVDVAHPAEVSSHTLVPRVRVAVVVEDIPWLD